VVSKENTTTIQGGSSGNIDTGKNKSEMAMETCKNQPLTPLKKT